MRSFLPIISVEVISKLSYRIFLEKGLQDFQSLDSQGKSSFVLGSELWRKSYLSFLRIWELRKLSCTIILTFSSPVSGVLPEVIMVLGKFEGLCGNSLVPRPHPRG